MKSINSGRMTLEFWSRQSSIINDSFGVLVFLDKHIGVALVANQTTNTSLDAICFPQDYKANLDASSGGKIVSGKKTVYTIKSDLDSGNTDTETTTSAANTWVWTRCAVNIMEKKFYISANSEKILTTETIYGTIKSSYPFRYFTDSNSNFMIKGPSQDAARVVYIGQVLLFSEYLPTTFKFKNL
ncbi:MAG: hypothetical protein GY861_10480 [bacterium]|nr:hypothetical protein [bacterium]